MESLNENRVPKAWIGHEVKVKSLGFMGEGVETFGKLEDVHEGGLVLFRTGPTPEVGISEPILFYPWSSVEILSLREAHSEEPETRGEPQLDRAGAGGGVERIPPVIEPKLSKVVPIAQQRSAAGVTVTLRSLEIYEDAGGLIGYLLSPGPEQRDRSTLRQYSFPEVRVRDDRGRSYEAHAGYVVRALSGELWLASAPEADATELEVEIVRLFEGPFGEGRGGHLAGPWVFQFSL